jgi:hypothetical protein
MKPQAKFSGGNILAVDPEELRRTGSVIVTGITESFNKVRTEYVKHGSNLIGSYVVNNPVLKTFEVNGSILAILKNNVPRIDTGIVFSLKVSDFWENGMKTLDRICDTTGLNISLVTYMRLSRILRLGCERAVPDPGSANRNISINAIFTGPKKGSQVVRKVLLMNKVEKSKEQLLRLRQVRTFFHLIEIPVPEITKLQKIYGSWGMHFLPNKTRDFVFKIYNNTVY